MASKKNKKPLSGKKNNETVVMQLRLSLDLREAFNLSCRNMDMSSSQVLRVYMRKYVAQNSQQSFILNFIILLLLSNITVCVTV